MRRSGKAVVGLYPGIRTFLRWSVILAAAHGALLSGPAATAEPRRVVSINLCTDQLLLVLADREQIASISFLGADPSVSNTADLGAGLPTNRGLAEEVLGAKPDLVLAGAETTQSTTALIRALGYRVETFAMANTVAEASAQIHRLAALLGKPGRGNALAARLDAATAAARAAVGPDRAPRVLLYSGRGFTSGRGTLVDDLFATIGVRNAAAARGAGYFTMPLEQIVADPPDLLIVGEDYADAPSLALEFLRHPALLQADFGDRRVAVPTSLWTCAGPWLGEAAARIATAVGATDEAAP